MYLALDGVEQCLGFGVLHTSVKEADPENVGVADANIDRGFIKADFVAAIRASGGEVICRPWVFRNGKYYPKSRFRIDLDAGTITCPAEHVLPIVPGKQARFPAAACDCCPQRAKCTGAKKGCGRTVSIAEDEALQQQLRALVSTPEGRERLRERVSVEHRQAKTCRLQGERARYLGCRKNLFHLRVASSIANLQLIKGRLDEIITEAEPMAA